MCTLKWRSNDAAPPGPRQQSRTIHSPFHMLSIKYTNRVTRVHTISNIKPIQICTFIFFLPFLHSISKHPANIWIEVLLKMFSWNVDNGKKYFFFFQKPFPLKKTAKNSTQILTNFFNPVSIQWPIFILEIWKLFILSNVKNTTQFSINVYQLCSCIQLVEL